MELAELEVEAELEELGKELFEEVTVGVLDSDAVELPDEERDVRLVELVVGVNVDTLLLELVDVEEGDTDVELLTVAEDDADAEEEAYVEPEDDDDGEADEEVDVVALPVDEVVTEDEEEEDGDVVDDAMVELDVDGEGDLVFVAEAVLMDVKLADKVLFVEVVGIDDIVELYVKLLLDDASLLDSVDIIALELVFSVVLLYTLVIVLLYTLSSILIIFASLVVLNILFTAPYTIIRSSQPLIFQQVLSRTGILGVL